MNTAIAQHLNVAESAIIEVQEWARVLWVRVKGLGARFVSKKVKDMARPVKADKYIVHTIHDKEQLLNVPKRVEWDYHGEPAVAELKAPYAQVYRVKVAGEFKRSIDRVDFLKGLAKYPDAVVTPVTESDITSTWT